MHGSTGWNLDRPCSPPHFMAPEGAATSRLYDAANAEKGLIPLPSCTYFLRRPEWSRKTTRDAATTLVQGGYVRYPCQVNTPPLPDGVLEGGADRHIGVRHGAGPGGLSRSGSTYKVHHEDWPSIQRYTMKIGLPSSV